LNDETSYALVSPRDGLLATLRVGAGVPRFERVWPPPGLAVLDGPAVLCGTGTVPSAAAIELLLGDVEARIAPGIGSSVQASDRCVTLDIEPPFPNEGFSLMPRDIDAVAMDPAPLEFGPAVDEAPVVCGAGEVELGPGCVTPFDNRLLVRGTASPALWVLSTGDGQLLQIVEGGQFVVPELAPPEVLVRGVVLDRSGGEYFVDTVVELGEPSAAPVITEVYADALGPEPGQEWVEIVNAGSAPARLRGFTLEDGSAKTPLPDATLAPGGYAVVLRADYDVHLDPAPAAEATLLVVERIGGQGLSNAGEALRLSDAEGRVTSRFPARPARPGLSVARRFPWSLDADPRAFARHAAPGASPGAPNTLEED
jgi:hypothetical protein